MPRQGQRRTARSAANPADAAVNPGPLAEALPSPETIPRETSETHPSVISDIVREQFKKTILCRFAPTRCSKGESCPFAHGPEDLQPRPDLTKTSLCRAFQQGCCPESDETCRFAHNKRQLRKTFRHNMQRAVAGAVPPPAPPASAPTTPIPGTKEICSPMVEKDRSREEMADVTHSGRRVDVLTKGSGSSATSCTFGPDNLVALLGGRVNGTDVSDSDISSNSPKKPVAMPQTEKSQTVLVGLLLNPCQPLTWSLGPGPLPAGFVAISSPSSSISQGSPVTEAMLMEAMPDCYED